MSLLLAFPWTKILLILLWVVLGILALALLIVLAVLLVPIRYRFDGEIPPKDERASREQPDEPGKRNAWVKARARWLLGLASAKASLEKKEFTYSIKILGIPVTIPPGKGLWAWIKENKEFVELVLLTLGKLLKPLLPRRCDLYLRYGFPDPAATGEVLGLYYALRAATIGADTKKRKLSVEPDFAEAELEYTGWAKGHFRIGYVLYLLLKTYANHETGAALRAYKDIRKMSEEGDAPAMEPLE